MSEGENEKEYVEDMSVFDDKEYENIIPKDNHGVLRVIKGPVAEWGKLNRNKRFYSEKLWDKVLNSSYVKEQLSFKTLYGEANHPESRYEVDFGRVSHQITDMWKVPYKNQIYATINILNTPFGRILNTLYEAGGVIGYSSRAGGALHQRNGYVEVDENSYNFITFDAVPFPSVEVARPNNDVNESTENIPLMRLTDEAHDKLCKVIKESFDLNISDTVKDFIYSLRGYDLSKEKMLLESANIISAGTINTATVETKDIAKQEIPNIEKGKEIETKDNENIENSNESVEIQNQDKVDESNNTSVKDVSSNIDSQIVKERSDGVDKMIDEIIESKIDEKLQNLKNSQNVQSINKQAVQEETTESIDSADSKDKKIVESVSKENTETIETEVAKVTESVESTPNKDGLNYDSQNDTTSTLTKLLKESYLNISNLKSSNQALTVTRNSLLKENAELRKSLNESLEKVAEKIDVNKIKSDSEEVISNIRESYDNTINQKDEKIKELSEQLEDVYVDLDGYGLLKESYGELKTKYNRILNKPTYEDEFNDLTEKYNSLNESNRVYIDKLSEMTTESDAKDKEIANLVVEVAETSRVNESLQEQVEQLKSINESLQSEVGEAKSINESLQRDKTISDKQDKARYEREIRRNKVEIKELNESVKAMRNIAEQYKEELVTTICDKYNLHSDDVMPYLNVGFTASDVYSVCESLVNKMPKYGGYNILGINHKISKNPSTIDIVNESKETEDYDEKVNTGLRDLFSNSRRG